MLDASLEHTALSGVEVIEVVGQATQSSETTQLLLRKKAAVVSDTLSAEMIQKSTGGAAADLVKRAPAVTVKSDKFIFVRGLGERYSFATLNGSKLPSTDPQRRAVPLHLFPSDFLESLSIVKSYTPDLPGDFSGGLADLQLRSFPPALTYSVQLEGGGNTQTTFRTFRDYRGSTYDAFGLGKPFLHRSVAAHFTRGQVAESDTMTERRVFGDDAADADLDVVRVRSDGQQINRGYRHRVQPNTSSALSSWPRAARARMRAARKAPASVSPELPSANRCREPVRGAMPRQSLAARPLGDYSSASRSSSLVTRVSRISSNVTFAA